MEDAGGQHRVRTPVPDGGHEVGGRGGPARRDHRDRDALADRVEQLRVEARPGAVTIDRGHQQLPGAELDRAQGPGDRVQAHRLAPALHDHLEARGQRRVAGRHAPGIDGHHDRLAAETCRASGHEPRIGHGTGVETDLVGTGPEDVPHVVDAPDAAAHRERDEGAARGALHDVEERAPALWRGGDVEEDNLVSALAGVAFGKVRRVSLVDQIDEVGALHDAPVGDVQAGDHAATQHQARLARRTTLATSLSPLAPERSGWNWTPRRRPRATAETNRDPWSVSPRITARPASPAGTPTYE